MNLKTLIPSPRSPVVLAVLALFVATMTYVVASSFAASGTATMSMSPGGSQSTRVGNTFPVAINISTQAGVPVTGGAVYMSYPAEKLQVVSIDYTNSQYNLQLVEEMTPGLVRIERAALPMLSGDNIFATVTFKAIKQGKSVPITYAAQSKVISGEDDTNILSTKSGVTYRIQR